MEFLGIKIDKEILFSSPLLLNLFLVILLISIIKLAFGKEIKILLLYIWNRIINRDKNKSIKNWTAVCIDRQGWKQKADGIPLELENRHLKKLSFEVNPIGKPINWRGGFILGNEKYHPQSIVDNNNSVLFHVGSPPPIDKAQYIWYYDKDHKEGDPASTTVTRENKTGLRFQVKIDKYHILKVLVNGQQVYNTKIPSLFRNKVYLLAWGDHADCKVRFSNIRYSI